jgi:hypothetical protein
MITYRNRKAFQIDSGRLRVTVLVEGGHIAELFHHETGVNPLWTPPWPSIEPSAYDPARRPEYGQNAESKLLCGIMGHNLCLDIFGGPSEEEAAAGLSVHGEASVAPYEISVDQGMLIARATLPEAQLRFTRTIRFTAPEILRIEESVENLTGIDKPVGWTQHVTLGDPFVEPGVTEFRASATKSKVFESDFAGGKGYMLPGAEFDWPYVPRIGGGVVDMRRFVDLPVSGAFSTHLMDPGREQAYFLAWSPKLKTLAGYVWKRADFPWLGIWEENRSRTSPPWNGRTITRGMEFGVSPMPETRRAMVERGRLFGERTFRWIPAKSTVRVSYCAFVMPADSIPEAVAWDGTAGLDFSA